MLNFEFLRVSKLLNLSNLLSFIDFVPQRLKNYVPQAAGQFVKYYNEIYNNLFDVC